MLNPDTGKRQRSTSGPALPAKKDKPDVPTYDQYEREFLQANVLGSNVTAADRERVSSVSRRIPPELHAKYKKTLMYRHPVWKALPTPSSDMLNSLHSLQWPTDCMDLSTSTLLDPVLPPGTSPLVYPSPDMIASGRMLMPKTNFQTFLTFLLMPRKNLMVYHLMRG